MATTAKRQANAPDAAEQAARKQRSAASERNIARSQCGPYARPSLRLAAHLEQEAADLLRRDAPLEVSKGEAISTPVKGEPLGRLIIRDTLKDGDGIAECASIKRTDLLLQPSTDIVALAMDAAESIETKNSLEKMLAHQMALAHHMAMKIGNTAMTELWRVEQAELQNRRPSDATVELQRLCNSTARLMGAFQDGLMTLQRLRSGGNQTMTVQHVHVGDGGQAVIGNVQAGVKAKGGEAER